MFYLKKFITKTNRVILIRSTQNASAFCSIVCHVCQVVVCVRNVVAYLPVKLLPEIGTPAGGRSILRTQLNFTKSWFSILARDYSLLFSTSGTPIRVGGRVLLAPIDTGLTRPLRLRVLITEICDADNCQ